MARDVTDYQTEIATAIKKIQMQGFTIIPRRLIEEEVKNFPGSYPKLKALDEIPRKMAISAAINQRSDAVLYVKRPASWIFSPPSFSQVVSA